MIHWYVMRLHSSINITDLLMRSHHLWPRKPQNHTILVILEAIQTTMIASKLFRPLYLGYN